MGTVSAETDIQDNSVDLISNIGTESDVQDVSVDLVANTDSIASDVQDVSVDLIANSDSGLNLSSLSSSENGKTYEIYEADDWADAWVDMRDYSGTITLNINKNLDITYALEDDKYQYNNKFASKTLIINGNNHQIRSDNDFNFLHDFFELGNNQRFLEIYGDKRVILNNIRFDGFGLRIGQYRGALIYMAGSSYLEMNNCHINGVFVGSNGLGVITLRGESTLKMINTTLQNTQNIWGANSASAGVYLNDPGTSAEIFNCTFKNLGNSTHNPNWGGAICTYGKLYCEGCSFNNLTAGYGAAISIHDYKSQVAIQNSNFIDCKSVYTGIINVEGSEAKDIKLTKCSFINNKVLSLKNYASLIYLNNRYEEISLTKCIFYNSNPDNVNIVYLAASGSNQKILLDQCFRFNYNNIGNTGHGTWSQNWLTQEFEGDNTARLYDIKNYTLVFKDPNGRIVNDMPNCPALPIKIMANNNEVLRTSVVPMNQNNKGTFEVKFNQFADHLFYTYKPTDSNLVFCKRVRLVNGYVSLDTNLVKGVVNNFSEKVDISLNLYYNDNKNYPYAFKHVYYVLDNGPRTLIGNTDVNGHITLSFNNLIGKHTITFSTDPEPNIVPLNAQYMIFVKKGTKFVDVNITSTDNDFIIKGKLLDSSNNPLPINEIIFIHIKCINGTTLISTNTTCNEKGEFTYNSGYKLPQGTYLVSLTFKGNEIFTGTTNVSQIIIDGQSTILQVPSEINGVLGSEVSISANLIVGGKNYNLPNGVWFFTTQDWWAKFVTGRCTFDEIQWFNNNKLTPVSLDYDKGIKLGLDGSNVIMDLSVIPSLGTYYAFFLVKEDLTIDLSPAFNLSCLIVKDDSIMQVIPNTTSITYGEDVELKIIITDKLGIEGATGQVDIYINGVFVQSVYLDEGSASTVLKDFKIGVNEVEVRYLGDDNFIPANKSVNITVNKKDLNFDVFIDDTTYGFNVIAYIDGLPSDFNGKIQFVNLEDGEIIDIFDFNPAKKYDLGDDFEVGDYDINVTAYGDDRYNDKTVTTSFNVDKINTIVEVNVPEYITQGNDIIVNFNVLPSSATGEVHIYLMDGLKIIDEETFELSDDDEKSITFDGSNLEADKLYKVKVEYEGDEHHKASAVESDLTVVSKDVTQISAAVEDIYYVNEHVVVEFNVTVVDYLYSVTEGNVTITLYYENGTAVLDENGQPISKTVDVTSSKVDLGCLNESTYKVYITYNGSPNYLNSSNFYYFDVVKHDSETVVSINYDSDRIPILTVYVLPADATGSYQVFVNDDLYGTYDVSTHEIVLNNLTGGFYDLVVFYEGDSKYDSSMDVNNFTIRYDPTIDMKISYDYDYDIFKVITLLPDDATGTYVLYADGNITGKYDVNNNTVEIRGLGEGTHKFTVIYNGDYKYNLGSKTTVFSTMNTSFIDLEINYNNETRIAVLDIQVLPLSATGNYTVFINGKEYDTFDVSKTKVILDDLKSGEYRVEVFYWGDDTYNQAYNSGNFTVTKKDSVVYVDVPKTVMVGDDITVNFDVLPSSASGNVTIYLIDGVKVIDEKTVVLTDGEKSVIFDGSELEANKCYKVLAEYSGDAYYNSDFAEADLIVVSKGITRISAIVDDVYYVDEHIIVEFNVNVVNELSSVTEGNVTITLYYENGTAVLDKEGQVISKTVDVTSSKVDLGCLNGDNYKVYLTYNGSPNYSKSSNFYYFDVVRYDSETIVSVKYDADRVPTLNIEIIPIGATGNYTVFLNGEESGTFDVSKTKVILDDLKSGEYEVKVFYGGDDNYNPSYDFGNFTVTKQDTVVYVDVPESVVTGEDIVVNFNVLPLTVDGNVTIYLTDKIYNVLYNETVDVKDKPIIIDGSYVEVGESYKIVVVYNGNDKYNSSSNSTNFTVIKHDFDLDVCIDDVTYGDNVVAYMDGLPADFNGTIQFVISKEGKIVSTLDFNPSKQYDLGSDYEVGTYDVSVKSFNDDRYKDKTVKTNFNVNMVDTIVYVDVPETVAIGEDIVVNFNVLPLSVDGNVTIYLTDKIYNVLYNETVDVKDKPIIINGSYLEVGESYKIVVVYNGMISIIVQVILLISLLLKQIVI